MVDKAITVKRDRVGPAFGSLDAEPWWRSSVAWRCFWVLPS